jgi:hypothetical protein
MGGFVAAWLVGEGILIYRSFKVNKVPPGPGQLLLSSGVFVLLGLLAESKQARPLAVTLAWGFDIAAFMNVASVGAIKANPSKNWPPQQASTSTIFPDGKGQSTDLGVGTWKKVGPGGAKLND